mmetsp:Transcript_48742/g.58998  ORF Transcript_48742/g.58998 Transcript_48742/m.58998 type:complete len:389 (+) Transcript_48742:43-1209(+)
MILKLYPTALLLLQVSVSAFQSGVTPSRSRLLRPLHSTTQESVSSETSLRDEQRRKAKQSLLGLIGTASTSYIDPVLACPETGDALKVTVSSSPIIDSSRIEATKLKFVADNDSGVSYKGRSDSYYDLLVSPDNDDAGSTPAPSREQIVNSLRAFLPPPLRAAFSKDYIPMRDLFTSPAVSFAYERGWRQGFAAAGFPGVDREFELVQEYFTPAVVGKGSTVVVDMSCATGLMTRRLARSNDYTRVLGCDYSPSMLTEARRRIKMDPALRKNIELVRCDVAQIPMKTKSVDALHAGAAMHCWPDVDSGLSEIYRVLKTGGRYFGSTFLSNYFSTLQNGEGNVSVSQQAFNYFTSADEIKNMFIRAGFEEKNVDVEVLGKACIIVRCEK